MTSESEPEPPKAQNFEKTMEELTEALADLYSFRDMFFEHNPIEKAVDKNKLVEEKMNVLAEKFDKIEENQIPSSQRAYFLYLKGRMYNVGVSYDPRATQCLSKAVKLNPKLVSAWNELGESYWKNMSIKDAKMCFEGALKHERNRVTLRCLSLILRQDCTSEPGDHATVIQRSVDLAKEAVAQDPKDGLSWSVLGNAHLCKYFLVAQEPATLKYCLSTYKQAELDPISRGRPDLFYNNGVALKYNEQYPEALENFKKAAQIEPDWEVPIVERTKLEDYLSKVHELIRTKGKIKGKKLIQMVQTIEKKHLGQYADKMKPTKLSELVEGENSGCVVVGKVVGSVLSDNMVPFTFAMVDDMECAVSVTVYNWQQQRGVIIGDTVTVPNPVMKMHSSPNLEYNFKSIRVNNPLILLVNGKKVSRTQFAGTRVTSTYEIH